MNLAAGNPGRIAGILYLAVVVGSLFSLIYVPGQLQLGMAGTAIAERIAANEGLFRAGIVAWVATQVVFLLLPVALFRLIGSANRTAGALMILFVLASVPLSLAAVSHRLDALELATGGEGELLVRAALDSARHLQGMATLFWGLWLAPLGFLIVKSRSLPRVLGYLLMLGCVGYAINFFASLLVTDFRSLGVERFVRLPATLGEIGTCLWLVVIGAKKAED